MLQYIHWPWLRKQHQAEFSDADLQLYKLEKVTNFRWVAHHLGKRSDITLSSKELVSSALQNEISKIGQFAEIAYGLYDAELVWKYLVDLSKPDYPLESHDALRDAALLTVLHGRFAGVQAIVSHRKKEKQLVFAFSGTFTVKQALYDINAFQTKCSSRRRPGDSRRGSVKVHAGFWRLYRGIRRLALQTLTDRISRNESEKKLDIEEVVVTGHSLGAALSLLFMMDLLNPESCSKYITRNEPEPLIPLDVKLSLVLFGAPRVGNAAFAEAYRDSAARFREERGDERFRDYSIKGYNDGVPALPAMAFGYRHTVTNALFLHHGQLYHTPPSECECANFNVIHDEEGYGSSPPPFPLGGHNYYNGHNLEKTARRMDWAMSSRRKNSDEDWQRGYMEKLEKEKRRLEKLQRKNRALKEKEDKKHGDGAGKGE